MFFFWKKYRFFSNLVPTIILWVVLYVCKCTYKNCEEKKSFEWNCLFTVEGRVLGGSSFLTCSCLGEELVAGRLIVVEKFWNVKTMCSHLALPLNYLCPTGMLHWANNYVTIFVRAAFEWLTFILANQRLVQATESIRMLTAMITTVWCF